jgi:hypothetical protein
MAGAEGVCVGTWSGACSPFEGVVVAGVVVAGVVVAGVVCAALELAPLALAPFEIVRPWNAFAAISESAPERPTTAAISQRVTVEIRCNPASRAIAARRVAICAARR